MFPKQASSLSRRPCSIIRKAMQVNKPTQAQIRKFDGAEEVKKLVNYTIDQCARVADECAKKDSACGAVGDSIRKLKDEP